MFLVFLILAAARPAMVAARPAMVAVTDAMLVSDPFIDIAYTSCVNA